MVCFFCAFNITGDIKNLVQISTILVLFNKIEIRTKFLLSPVIDSTKKQTTFWKCQDHFVVIVSRIILLKVGWQLNVTNKFNVQRRLSIRLATVMFRGTPCKTQQMGTNYSPFLCIYMILGTNKQTLKLLKLQTMEIETRNKIPRCIVQKNENISTI